MSKAAWTNELRDFAELKPRKSLATDAADNLREFIMLGKLAPGMLADVVVMDADLESLEAERIGTARAALTLCGGEITWEA